jgi:hypothetical protein
MKAACAALEIVTTVYKHYGRKMKPGELEMFKELSDELIKLLGNWSPSMQKAAYSAKMPIAALRPANGFDVEQGRHWNKRHHCAPSEALRKQVWLSVGLDVAAKRATIVGKNKPTAEHFLNMLDHFATVILQDAAILMDTRSHPMFREIDVFKSPEFLLFQNTMRVHMLTATDPMNAAICHVLPGALEAIRSTRSAVESGNVAATLSHNAQMNVIRSIQKNMITKNDACRMLAAGASALPSLAEDNAEGENELENTVQAGVTAATTPTTEFQLSLSWSSSKDVMDEWLGRGRCMQNGGIAKFKLDHAPQFQEWKRNGNAKRFSRINQVVTGVQNRMRSQGGNEDAVAACVDAGVTAEYNGHWTLQKAIDWLIKSGDLPSKRRR